jgi:hypothetical protein
MTHRAEYLLTLLAAIALPSCGDDALRDPMDDVACQRLLDAPTNLDAFDWLKTPSPLVKKPGTMSLDQALSLAYRLDSAGATRVVAVGIAKVGSDEESSGMVLTLPEKPAERLAVFRMYDKLLQENGGVARADTGQKLLFVPWTGAKKTP